jgi:hypothetical protein
VYVGAQRNSSSSNNLKVATGMEHMKAFYLNIGKSHLMPSVDPEMLYLLTNNELINSAVTVLMKVP